MEQLRMIWRPLNGGSTEYSIPEGYTVRPMLSTEISQWCETSIELTGGKQWEDHIFIDRMLFNPPLTLSPRHIYCAFSPEGEMAATAAACLDGVKRIGDLHMVTARQEFKGKGLGKAVCAEAVNCFIANGCVEADLSTDDFRKPAIAIYLKLGFRPWLYLDDMRGRWTTVLTDMGWKKDVFAYDANRFDTYLYQAD